MLHPEEISHTGTLSSCEECGCENPIIIRARIPKRGQNRLPERGFYDFLSFFGVENSYLERKFIRDELNIVPGIILLLGRRVVGCQQSTKEVRVVYSVEEGCTVDIRAGGVLRSL